MSTSAASVGRPAGRTTLIVVAVLATLQALMVLAFAWPAGRTGLREVPVVVAGGPAAVAGLTERLSAEHPGAFEVTRVADRTRAREALRSRDAYGAVLLDSPQPEVLVASAASPTVSQALSGLAAGMDGSAGAPVEDVVATGPDDPRGAFLSAGLLPLVMTSVIAGAALALVVSAPRWRAAGVGLLAVLGGLVVAGTGHALGGLQGTYAVEAGVVALTIVAVSGTVAGAGSLLGHAGIPPAALVMMLLGNPLSGASSAPEMLPRPWGALGQLLPPGAGSQALRSVTYFDGVGAATPLLVLSGWAVAGLGMVALAGLRARRTRSTAAVTVAPAEGEQHAIAA
jgi:hypothetical protein